MLNNLKDAFMDPSFHKKLVQQIALAVIVSAVTVVAQQASGVIVSEVRTKIEEMQQVTVIPESAQ